jgi:hypothetical protein
MGSPWEESQSASKLAKGGKKGYIGRVHHKCVQGAFEAGSSCILSSMRGKIAKFRWELRLYQKKEWNFPIFIIKPTLQTCRNLTQGMVKLFP